VNKKLDIAAASLNLSQKIKMALFVQKFQIKMERIRTAAHLHIQRIKKSSVLTKMKYINSINHMQKRSSSN
jgi:hypothetical protein